MYWQLFYLGNCLKHGGPVIYLFQVCSRGELDMKCSSKIFMCLTFILLVFASQACANYFTGHVVEVVNDYTLKVLVDDEVKVVRLAEIISPNKRFGSISCKEQAKEFLLEITSEKEVTLEFWATDVVGRIVCKVFLPDGSSLAELLVSKGYALQDRYYSSSRELSLLERVAKKNKYGTWRHVASIL
jgi:endonuclease YncB( thermonuclease family)